MRTRALVVFILSIYFFIFSIELIKESALALSGQFAQILQVASPAKAVGAGWLGSAIVQSGGAVSATSIVWVGTGILTAGAVIFIILGAFVGRTITADIVSIFMRGKAREFRQGFEIAAANNIYNISLLLIMFPLEYFFKIFSSTAIWLGEGLEGVVLLKQIPNVIEIFCGFLVRPLLGFPLFAIIFGFVILVLSMEFLAKSVLWLLGGKLRGRKIIAKYMDSTRTAFAAGLFITLIIPSTNITISLLVPLAVTGIIKLRQVIPYILGANIGTVLEVILAALVTGQAISVSTSLIYAIFAIVGAAIWLPNMGLLHSATKELSKHILHVSRPRAIGYLAVFILVPILFLFL